jgi:hypothetical protein
MSEKQEALPMSKDEDGSLNYHAIFHSIAVLQGEQKQ